MLPPAEVSALIHTIMGACELAAAGAVEGARTLLLSGICRSTDAYQAGEPWAGELRAHYEEALARFSDRYPPKNPAPGALRRGNGAWQPKRPAPRPAEAPGATAEPAAESAPSADDPVTPPARPNLAGSQTG